MELPGVGNPASADDVVAGAPAEDGRRASTAVAGDRGGGGASRGRPTSGIRRILVAPASDGDVTQSQEPPQDAIHCSWKPMKPGYKPTSAGDALLIERTVRVEDFDHDDDADNSFRLAIPVMSCSLAVVCAVCNVLTPGLGTLIAGLSISCGSQVRLQHKNKVSAIMLNTWVALLQLTTTPLFLIGWIWSVVWSSDFISISKKYHSEQQLQRQNDEESRDEDEAAATCRRQHAVRRTTTTTTLSLPQTSPQPPIIVLHGTPVSPQVQPHHGPLLVSAQRRRQSRRYSTSSTAPLPEVLLSPGVLETIIVPDYSSRRASSTSSSSR